MSISHRAVSLDRYLRQTFSFRLALVKTIFVNFFLCAITTSAHAQDLQGVVGSDIPGDQFLTDFFVENQHVSFLYSDLYQTRPDSIFLTFLSSTSFPSAPVFMGSNFKGLKVVVDSANNQYICGIYSPNLGLDSTTLLLIKYDPAGKIVWTSRHKYSDANVQLVFDESGHLYLANGETLTKIQLDGQIIWKKDFPGSVRYHDQHFYGLLSQNVFDVFLIGEFCQNLLLSKMDTSGQMQFQIVINEGLIPDSSIFSTNFSYEILNNQIFISNSYWGKIDLDPSDTELIFENYFTNNTFGVILRPIAYLAIYNLNGDIVFANSKLLMPKFEQLTVDSDGYLYFTCGVFIQLDFDLSASS